MRTVRTPNGTTYLLVKESGESSLVRDPHTGAEKFVRNDDLEPVDSAPLETIATAVPKPIRKLVTATHTDRTLGLLVALDQHGPRSAIDLLETYDLCESDLLGALTEFRAAGLVEDAEVAGQRGYALTDDGATAVEFLTR